MADPRVEEVMVNGPDEVYLSGADGEIPADELVRFASERALGVM